MIRKAARLLVWLALGASLLVDARWAESFWLHAMSPFAEPYSLWDWTIFGASVVAQSGLMLAEIRLRPPRQVQTLHLSD